MAIRVGINGFGRIGRLFYRAAVRQGGFEIRIRAAYPVLRGDPLAALGVGLAEREPCPPGRLEAAEVPLADRADADDQDRLRIRHLVCLPSRPRLLSAGPIDLH